MTRRTWFSDAVTVMAAYCLAIVLLLIVSFLMAPIASAQDDFRLLINGGACEAPLDPDAPVRLHDTGRVEVEVTELPDCEGEVIDPPPDDGPCPVLPEGWRLDSSVRWELGNDPTVRTARSYAELFGPWPLVEERQSASLFLELRERIHTLAFTVPETGGPRDRVKLLWEESRQPSDSTTVTVSACQGGILVSQALDPGCHVVSGRTGADIIIGVDPETADCVVERGRSYWLNLANIDAVTAESTCQGATCLMLLRPLAIGANP